MNADSLNAFYGGILIGLATVLLMHFNGRIAGISGIVNGLFKIVPMDWGWRVAFVGGLVAGGLIMNQTRPEGFIDTEPATWPLVIAAGLLVGFGTIMGSGCTSGHGVCGISRLSKRSILATITFIAAGIITVTVKNWIMSGVGQ
jgi:uncharacterized membrane protein YedE/YeeE